MRVCTTHILCSCAGAVVFSVLLGSLTAPGVITGALSGLLFAAVVRTSCFSEAGPFLGSWLARYGALLLRDMALATARQMRAALRRAPPQPAILRLTAKASERGRVLVANSVTLTPGTVTLEETQESYIILCSDIPTSSGARSAVVRDFEARLNREGPGS